MRKSGFFRAVGNRFAAFGAAGAASNRAGSALARGHTSGSEPKAKTINRPFLPQPFGAAALSLAIRPRTVIFEIFKSTEINQIQQQKYYTN
ncbi:hypothetical protein GGTG_10366 [Gaeumannomyces tritici R3-111a-1]|uniref:Uncharacterized protein n=1 Tax=Gaeumannomyces tritici (strain R3-111a-1) TaxID=644352 RepID=J3PA42_GAET3|nr:hypothetical protein GGTG_10366 [Gaeumannomyces tritici R3-111a-1]EJT73529.1 hypothetical protein GGTG_10366 [Gaeumannomyces tritici R3-111a-1]